MRETYEELMARLDDPTVKRHILDWDAPIVPSVDGFVVDEAVVAKATALMEAYETWIRERANER